MQGAQPEVAEAVVGAVGQACRPARPAGAACSVTNSAVRSAIRPSRWPTATEAEKDTAPWPAASSAMVTGQQPGGEPGVRRVLGDQPGGRLGGQRAQLGLVRPGVAGRAARRRRPGRGRCRAGRRSARSGSAAARSRGRRPCCSETRLLKPDRLARWSRGALPRSARGRAGRARARTGMRDPRQGSTARRPPAQPRGPDVSAPGSVEPDALSAGPRTRGHATKRTHCTPLRDSSGFAPDSPAATASMSIHVVAGLLTRPPHVVSWPV